MPIASGDFLDGGHWGADDTILFAKSRTGLMRVPAAGGPAELLTGTAK